MTVFAKNTMNVTEWSKVQDQIAELQTSLGAPHDLMMLSADTDDGAKQDIYLGLPDAKLLKSFPGFEQIKQRACQIFCPL